MKVSRKIQLIAAIGAVFAVVAVGTASSGEFTDTGVSVEAPAGALPQCADLIDNDRDEVFDLEDPDCKDALDNLEGHPDLPAATFRLRGGDVLQSYYHDAATASPGRTSAATAIAAARQLVRSTSVSRSPPGRG